MLAAILCICGTTLLTACAIDSPDNPVQPEEPEEKVVTASDVIGEWIIELQGQVEPVEQEEGIDYPTDADGITIIYHFGDDGDGWKEMNIMKGGEVVFVSFDRYSTAFKYIVDPSGSIRVIFYDENHQETDNEDQLGYCDDELSTAIDGMVFTLTRATEAQTAKYAATADAWHGGSAEGQRLSGVSNGDFKWGGTHPISEQQR